MNFISPLIIAVAPALPLLGVSLALLIYVSRRERSGKTQLMLLRGLVWAFGAVGAAYLSAQAVLLVKSDFQGFTLAACLPLVIFGTAGAATIWHIRNAKRPLLATKRGRVVR